MSETNITRRTIVKGAAWSIPVIAAAVAAPLAAASTAPQACLRFIGTNFTKKSLKVKLKNDCTATAKNVVLAVSYTSNGTPISEVVPLGDIAPGQPWPLDHFREYDIPADVTTVVITATADNAPTVTEALR